MRLPRMHRKRLLEVWRSAGWPFRDTLEIELLAAGLLDLRRDEQGRETVALSPAAIAQLAQDAERNRRSHSLHDRLAAMLAGRLVSSGRIVWRELSLRAIVGGAEGSRSVRPTAHGTLFGAPENSCVTPDDDAARVAAWRLCRPDIFSVRRTSVEQYLEPQLHEVKSSRADLLADLRQPNKRAAYAWLCSQYFYVFPEGMAEADEIPRPAGVVVARQTGDETTFILVRPASASPCQLPFAVWMAMASSAPIAEATDDLPPSLGGPDP